MKRLAMLSSTAAIIASLVASAALAKGASEATITGPGLGDGIRLAGEGQVGGDRLIRIAESAGFFPAVFLRSPNPMLSTRPRGELGPRYTVTYVMPGPTGVDELRQDLYPYAKPTPVTYTRPGQPFFGTEKTVGGWYVATSALKDDLVAVGMPFTPSADGGGFDVPWAIAGGAAAAVTALAAAALAVLRLRRRHGPATA